jgi:hypothetical protein
VKSLVKPKGRKAPPRTREANSDAKEIRREAERDDKAQCCAKRSRTTAGCHD